MGLGKGIHFQTSFHSARDGQDGQRLVVADKAVGVVVHDENAVTAAEIHQALIQLRGGLGSGGHTGIVGPHQFDAFQIHLFQSVEVRIPAVFFQQVVLHNTGIHHIGGRCIGGITGVRNQHAVSRIQESQGDEEDTFLGTGEGLDLGGRIQRHAIISLIPGGKTFPQFGDADIALIPVHAVFLGIVGHRLQGFAGRCPVRGADAQVDDGVQALRRAPGIETGHLLVLDGKVILLDGERSFCGFYDHKAALYSPNICTSSNRGRTACRAWR